MSGPASLIDAQSRRILDLLDATAAWHANHILGGAVTDGGSTQAGGANTAPNIDLDVAQVIDAAVDNQAIEAAAASDVDADAGDQIVWGAESGKAVIGALLLRADASYQVVFGAVADTGEQVAPTDAEIQAYFDANSLTGGWVRSAHVTVTRTGATAITVAISHADARPSLIDFASIAKTEATFRDFGGSPVLPITPTSPPA